MLGYTTATALVSSQFIQPNFWQQNGNKIENNKRSLFINLSTYAENRNTECQNTRIVHTRYTTSDVELRYLDRS